MFANEDWVYFDNHDGNIERFRGNEKIHLNEKEVFSQDYIGGLIIHK